MNGLLFLDFETCGLHSMPVLLQWALDEGPINLWDIWKHSVGDTLDLLEWILQFTVVGFNLTFDWFHFVKLYTIWNLLPREWIPEEHIDEIAMIEPRGQEGPCVKPESALDLLLHSRKGPYQSLMARDDIRIRRVPTSLAYALAEELENRVQLDSIYFAKSADKDAPRWCVFDRKNRDGDIDPDWKDVVLRFNAAGGLKFLAEHAMKWKPKYHYTDVEPPKDWYPHELGYAPTALAVSSPEENWAVYKTTKVKRYVWKYAWPGVIKQFIEHWATNKEAREYAHDDVDITRGLYRHFENPETGDDDSILACMVPVIRWRGFAIDVEGMAELRDSAQSVVDASPINVNKHNEVRAYITEAMDGIESLILEESTKKSNVEAIMKWSGLDLQEEEQEDNLLASILDGWDLEDAEDCTKCGGIGGDCQRCLGHGAIPEGKHPASLRAREVLRVKAAVKEVELYDKLIHAGKFHANFVIVGTKSNRMSGGGSGVNSQGIKKSKKVRKMFPLAWNGYVLSGGDFDSFEITLTDAEYSDPEMRKVLISGKKIHCYFGMEMYPGMTYEEVKATDGTDNDIYTQAKSGVFGLIYGGDWTTLVRNFGLLSEVAQRAEEGFLKRFSEISKKRNAVFDQFAGLSQPGGPGTAVFWKEPAQYVESFLGFRRYFTLEITIMRELFKLARSLPKEWRKLNKQVMRDTKHGRVQTECGTVSSALYGAAYVIQGAIQRAAGNHKIQSPGATITKNIQRKVWDLQPSGVHELLVAPMNVHDELNVVNHPDMTDSVAEVVKEGTEAYRDKVPLIGMTWNKEMANWAEKKGGAVTLKISPLEMANAT